MVLPTALYARAVMPSSRRICAKIFSNPSVTTRRQFSAPAMKVVVIHSIGIDRPGIVADITRIVTDKGGNVGESRAQLLGGHFSVMMLVDIAEKDAGDLQEQLAGVKGMKTECMESVEKNASVAPTIAFAGRFKLSGADDIGIVHKLTSVLARNQLTIANMKTKHEGCPFGGAELFTVEGRSVAYQPLASNFDWEKIREELKELGDLMNCDIQFDDVTGSTFRD